VYFSVSHMPFSRSTRKTFFRKRRIIWLMADG
jgi:hypothetical protein